MGTPSIFEHKWPTVILTPIGISNHTVTVSTTHMLHEGQVVTLSLTGNQADYIILRILSDTQLQISNIGQSTPVNPTEFNAGTLTASEQERTKMGSEIFLRAVYEEGPAVALRNVLVDWMGQHITSTNPLSVLADQGLPNSIVNAWPVKITDGTDQAVVNPVNENQNYSSSQHGIGHYGVDDSSPTRKWRPIKTDQAGHQYAHLLDAANNLLTATLNQGTKRSLDVNVTTTGQQVAADSIPVVLASDQTPLRSQNSIITSVTAAVTSTMILDINSSRRGTLLFNDSTSDCYVKFGTTASASSFTVKMTSQSLFIIESSPIYTGRIDAIWVTAVGAMRVTELT